MGIPICVRLAELMGGTIELADRGDGPGARFTLRLPLLSVAQAVGAAAPMTAGSVSAPPRTAWSPTTTVARVGDVGPAIERSATPSRATPAAAAAAAAREVHGTRVLAVDDSPANLRFLVFVLRRLGCVVSTCTDGDQVVTALAAADVAGAPFDLCVMDLYMERVNGDAALAALRAAGHELPVVLCTANATSADAARYESLGFASLVGKPFSPDQMRAAIAVADINNVVV